MAKTRRLIKECLPEVDIVIQLLDARIPYSSQNPEIAAILGDKPTLTVLNKASLADMQVSKLWVEKLSESGNVCICCDCINGSGISNLKNAINKRLSDKLKKYEDKGMGGRHVRAMVVGIPNVGKSTLINTLARSKVAKAEDRPGVTTRKQWISTQIGIDLLDMPGVLWPKFEMRQVGENLSITGAIKDDVIELHSVASALCARLAEYYPAYLTTRYKLADESMQGSGYDILLNICKKRGFLIKGGEVDVERGANMVLDEFRAGKIGRISLERP